MTDATTRALAELRRRREQHRIAAAHYRGEEPAGNTTERKAETHDHIARGLSTAIDVIQETSSDATTAPTVADDRMLSIVEIPESGVAHRRRRYTPGDGDADAHLETARFEADGWRVTGEDRLAQLAVDGERIFVDD
jgi:hypothetical protein